MRVCDTCQARRCACDAIQPRGSQWGKSPRRIAGRAFRLRKTSACSASRRPPTSLVHQIHVVSMDDCALCVAPGPPLLGDAGSRAACLVRSDLDSHDCRGCRAQLSHPTSAGARTRCVARLPRSQWNTVRLASAGRGPKGSMRAPWWTSEVGGRRRSARREIAPGSCSLAPAATKGCVCATHARRAGALVMRFSSADHNGGSRRDESPGALSGCAKHRRAPHRVGPPPRSSTRSITAVARNRRGDRVADHGVNASSCAMASSGRRPANR
jgi:hypothetical protein